MQSPNGGPPQTSRPDNTPAASPSSVHPPAATGNLIYQFEDFRLDPTNRLLTCAGKEVALPGRAFDALQMLVARPGELVTKEELLSHIWAGAFVEESNLTVAVSTLRRALNEDPQDRRYIQTVARRGYRFIATVTETEEQPRVARARAGQPVESPNESAAGEGLFEMPAAAQPGVATVHPHRGLRSRWQWAIALAAAVAVVTSGWLLLRPKEPVRTLAILPFRFSPAVDASEEGLEQLLGMTDALNDSLTRQVVVRPTSSVLRYTSGQHCSDSAEALAAGREQSVDAVLSGMVNAKAGVIDLCLLRVHDARVLWQESVSEVRGNPEATQRTINSVVAAELHHLGSISPPPVLPAVASTTSPGYQLYLRGRYFWNRRTVDGLRRSADYFKQSISVDPNYAPAYAGLADSYALLASFSVEPGSSSNADARSAAFSAIHLDPTLAEPHASLGMIYFFTDWNLTAAEREFELAIQLNPNYATAHHWYALDLAAMGRFPQALYEIRLAQKLDPLSLIIGTNVGWVEYLARDYPAATHDLQRVLELDPHFARARTRLGMVEMASGNNAAAVANLTEALALSADPQSADAHLREADPYVQGLLGAAQARAGNPTAAARILADLRKRSGYVPPVSRGLVLLSLDQRVEALAEFGRSVEDHSTSMVYARVDPAFDAVRSDSAFQQLLTRIRL